MLSSNCPKGTQRTCLSALTLLLPGGPWAKKRRKFVVHATIIMAILNQVIIPLHVLCIRHVI